MAKIISMKRTIACTNAAVLLLLAAGVCFCGPHKSAPPELLSSGASEKIVVGLEPGADKARSHNHHHSSSDLGLDRKKGPTTSGVGATPTPQPVCNVSSEFHCELEDRCVPLEWRCDFTEQCLGGQDELGCVAGWCNFDRDSCYWLSTFRKQQQRRQQFERPRGQPDELTSGNRRFGDERAGAIERAAFWRRYFGSATSRQMAQKSQLGAVLANMGAKFIFAPMSLEADDLEAARHAGQLIRRAHLVTPPIGRTNSRCQLRFEFALWSQLEAEDPRINETRPSVRVSLSLMARHIGRDGSGQQTEADKLLWSQTSRPDEWRSPTSTTRVDWTMGVAEVGHLKHFELAFEAKMIANFAPQRDDGPASAWGAGANSFGGVWAAQPAQAGQNEEASKPAAPASLDEASPFRGALVALRWLNFRACHWPQADLVLAASKTAGSGSRPQPASGSPDDLWAPRVSQLDDELVANISSGSCSSDEFRCSSGLCLAAKSVCDFVDDCMNPVEQEDESRELCSPLAKSSESFESWSEAGARQMQLFLSSHADQFWHLNGNWSMGRVTVRNNLQQWAHLPRTDHTTHEASGKYLSLEVPQFDGDRSSGSKGSLFWAGINSRWMEKANEEEVGECRVKFFYNLVSTQPRELYANESSAPFKFSLVVEHHSLRAEESAHQVDDSMGRRRANVASRQVDAILHSHDFANYAKSQKLQFQAETIEFAGVDFWREANFRLLNLNAGELFYIRLIVFVEYTGQPVGEHVASINLDDFGTHFGCGRAVDQEESAAGLKQEISFDDQLLAHFRPKEEAPRLAESIPQAYPFRDRLHRNTDWWIGRSRAGERGAGASNTGPTASDYNADATQVEPPKLVAYVSCAFCIMIGFIAVIVFVLVPYVERAMMSYQDQIQLSMGGEISDLPISSGTIYDLSNSSGHHHHHLHHHQQQQQQQHNQRQRRRRPRTISVDSIVTTTGFGSSNANSRRRSQWSMVSSGSSRESYFEADTNLDEPKASRAGTDNDNDNDDDDEWQA